MVEGSTPKAWANFLRVLYLARCFPDSILEIFDVATPDLSARSFWLRDALSLSSLSFINITLAYYHYIFNMVLTCYLVI